jgi:uncharacterized protein YbjQ (UPF0145 family)
VSSVPEQHLPTEVSKRLAELSDQFFTSDLSVNEFVLIEEAGFHPLGLVMGSSIYHTGFQTRRWTKSMELVKLSTAMYDARELAMARLEAEAKALGADGVVGVRLEANYHQWGRNAIEFIAVGTAIKSADGVAYHHEDGTPFTSDLSGQEFWMVLKAGYIPRSLVLGNCVFHIGRRSLGTTLRSLWRNIELAHITEGLYQARELAMTRMQDDALGKGADGIVGVTLTEKSHHFGNHVLEFLVLGTSVTKLSNPGVAADPITTISLER